MDVYHIWCVLKPGVRDLEFCQRVDAFLGALKEAGRIADYRVTRKKLGLAPPDMGEFHITIETTDLAQLDRAFTAVAGRAEPEESLHFGANSLVSNIRFGLCRDFPDPVRQTGAERF